MINVRPFPWEAHYPPGVIWDAPIRLTTLPTMLDEAAQRFGNRPAIEFRGAKITFAELARRADRFAAGLRKLGIKQGDALALLLHNTPFHPIAFFAVLRLGARVVHLSPLDPARAIASKRSESNGSGLAGACAQAVGGEAPAIRPPAASFRKSRRSKFNRIHPGETCGWRC